LERHNFIEAIWNFELNSRYSAKKTSKKLNRLFAAPLSGLLLNAGQFDGIVVCEFPHLFGATIHHKNCTEVQTPEGDNSNNVEDRVESRPVELKILQESMYEP
jgi:hypothetical protein